MPLYNARGILTAPLRTDRNVLSVDPALRDILANGIGTYLKVKGEAGVEVVRVVRVGEQVQVLRAQDNTEALPFNAGDKVEYVRAAAEIGADPVQIAVARALRMDDGRITYADLELSALGATEFIGGDSKVVIGRKEGAYGCCDGGNSPAPLGQVIEYLLTSRPYPLEVTESLAVFHKLANMLALTPPVDGMDVSLSILLGELREFIHHTYAMAPEALQVVDLQILSGELRTLLRTYSMAPEAIEVVDYRILGGQLRELLLTYRMRPDAMGVNLSIISGVLE